MNVSLLNVYLNCIPMLIEDLIVIVTDRYTAAEFVDLCDINLEEILTRIDGWEDNKNLLEDLGLDEETVLCF